MAFHLGKPLLFLFSLSLASGVIVMLRPAPPRADLAVWTFAEPHARVYRPLALRFERESGRSLAIDLVGERALNERLVSLFTFGRGGGDVPDAVEIGMGQVGKFFGPPVEEVGFLPLNAFLENSGYREIQALTDPGSPGWNARLITDRRVYTYANEHWVLNVGRLRPDAWIDPIPHSRFAPWSKAGRIFGVPRDVHPVALAYRADLYDAFKHDTGDDIEGVQTWEQFRQLAIRFERYWAGRGVKRYAIELQEGWPDHLATLLLQRRINAIDASGQAHLDDPKVAQTLAFYTRCVAGSEKISTDAIGNPGLWALDVNQGNVCAFLTPDWRVSDFRRYAPASAGRMRLRALPRFDATDPPTSTLGGTMIGIPRRCRDPQAAWKLVEFLYLSPAALDARSGALPPGSHGEVDATLDDTLPALIDEWDKPIFHQPDSYFGGQSIFALYVDLARQIPAQCVTPATPLANGYLTYVLSLSSAYLRDRGPDGLDAFVSERLKAAQADLVARIAQMQF